MLPSSITHLGDEYSLGHLAQIFRTFSWACVSGAKIDFVVRVRYSDHCISVTRVDPATLGEHPFDPPDNNRVFDTDRYKWSLELPEIIDGLFNKPTTPIQLTPEHNGYVFRLHMKHPLGLTEKYYCLVRLKRSSAPQAHQASINLDLFVESAYPRYTEPNRINERPMFGRLAERLIK